MSLEDRLDIICDCCGHREPCVVQRGEDCLNSGWSRVDVIRASKNDPRHICPTCHPKLDAVLWPKVKYGVVAERSGPKCDDRHEGGSCVDPNCFRRPVLVKFAEKWHRTLREVDEPYDGRLYVRCDGRIVDDLMEQTRTRVAPAEICLKCAREDS